MEASELAHGFSVELVEVTGSCRNGKLTDRCRQAIGVHAEELGELCQGAASAALKVTCFGPDEAGCGAIIEGQMLDEHEMPIGESFVTTALALAKLSKEVQ